ncbi:uncharacterized protein LOC120191543 isoform X2 [Hibiscus syriacus]|uniref:uncharacterized protein LOC120191543 isoform X2 n=1 Tax=Hibiscus syriacus TaxID=106335 RepID=UPI00192157A3|nr:uncharacterized protein LOC120191543 isoform X2 [Hibiscus syriacus]
MNQSDYSYGSLPNDIALKIAYSLEVPDLSSLSCCSRVWREICGSDCLWESLVKERWSLLYETVKDPNFKDWRGFYVKQHEEKKAQAASVVNVVEHCSQSESLEILDYLQAIECLKTMHFGFKDVQMLLLRPRLNVLLNLIGLNYCLNILQVPAVHIVEALRNSKIADRQVFVQWWKPGRWFYGFRIRNDSFRCVSLEDLAVEKDEEVLAVLEPETTHELLTTVQISVVNSTSNLQASQSSP